MWVSGTLLYTKNHMQIIYVYITGKIQSMQLFIFAFYMSLFLHLYQYLTDFSIKLSWVAFCISNNYIFLTYTCIYIYVYIYQMNYCLFVLVLYIAPLTQVHMRNVASDREYLDACLSFLVIGVSVPCMRLMSGVNSVDVVIGVSKYMFCTFSLKLYNKLHVFM